MRATTLAVTTANAISVARSKCPRCIRYLTSFYNMHKEGAVVHAGSSFFIYKRDRHTKVVTIPYCMNRYIV